jgi:CYTH domain-containing protein
MNTTRRFLIASALGRLIRNERGASRVTEGYFPNHPGRSSHVQVEGGTCSLVLVTTSGNAAPVEERTEVPRAHADALLDVAPGKVVYDRSRVTVSGREIFVDRFTLPGALDLIAVPFEAEDDARAFRPPVWFGPEVSGEQIYHNRSIALEGSPSPQDLPLSNGALESLLDVIENRFTSARARPATAARQPVQAESASRMGASSLAESGQSSSAKAESSAQASAGSSAEDDTATENIEDDVIRELARALGR